MHFSKMSYRSQAKLINIYENCGVFICHLPPVLMRYMLSICNFMLDLYVGVGAFVIWLSQISSLFSYWFWGRKVKRSRSQCIYRKIFYTNFCQVTVCGIHVSKRLHMVPYLAFGTNFLKKNHRKILDNDIASITSRVYRGFISCDIIVDFWYCLGCCILYSIKSKESSMKRSASDHVSLNYRQCIFFWLLRAYCFSNNLIQI